VMLGKPARIVNVSSLGQHPIDFDDVMLTRGYSGSRAYAQSKLAQIMFTFDLARELDPETRPWSGRAASRLSAPSRRERKRF
jgi:NAD(P)-dependent dehydrogenase (short-subunit alcohol dehydrogenase family)